MVWLLAAASEAAIGEVLLFCICSFAAAVTAGFGQWVASAAAGMQQALVGFLASVGVLALESPFFVVEGLDRHVLAGSLFSGTGEQAPGQVDVPGKDIQQTAAAAKEMPTICFFVKSLGGASYVVRMEHQATAARVRQHVDEDTLESLGVVRDMQLHMCSCLCGGAPRRLLGRKNCLCLGPRLTCLISRLRG